MLAATGREGEKMGFRDWFKGTSEKAKPELRRISLTSIQDRYSSYPSSGLTPGKLAAIFREADQGDIRRQMELYEEMEEKDAHLASILQTRKAAVQGMNYRFIPYSPEPDDVQMSEFVQTVIESLEFDRIMTDILDALGKGFSVHEIMWQVIEGKVVIEDIRWINPKRISFAEGEEPRLLEPSGYSGIKPPPWKLVVYRSCQRSGSVVRAGLLRSIAWVYLFKNYALKDWAIFNEVFGMPLRVGRYDPTASIEDRESLRRAIAAMGTDAAAIISKNTDIEFVEAGSRATGHANPFIAMAEFCNREMSKAILGQTLTTDVAQATGTYGAAKVHDQVRRDIVQSDADSLAATLRMQVFRPLIGFNFGWDHNPPFLHFSFKEEVDLKQISETYRNLNEMGIQVPQEHIAEVFGLPRVRRVGGGV